MKTKQQKRQEAEQRAAILRSVNEKRNEALAGNEIELTPEEAAYEAACIERIDQYPGRK